MIRIEKYSPQPGVIAKKKIFELDPVIGSKAIKSEKIYTQTVTVNSVGFDADETSLDRMTRVVTVANADIAKAIASGTDPAQAAQTVLQSTVQWKCADDVVRAITIADLSSALDAGVKAMAQKWIG